MINQPVEQAILRMGGAPTSSYGNVLTWTRTQGGEFGLLACTETMTIRDGKISTWNAVGHC